MDEFSWYGKPQIKKTSPYVHIQVPLMIGMIFPAFLVFGIFNFILCFIVPIFCVLLCIYLQFLFRQAIQRKISFFIIGNEIGIKYVEKLIKHTTFNQIHSIAHVKTGDNQGTIYLNYAQSAFAVFDEYQMHREIPYICFSNLNDSYKLFTHIKDLLGFSIDEKACIERKCNSRWEIKEFIMLFFILLPIIFFAYIFVRVPPFGTSWLYLCIYFFILCFANIRSEHKKSSFQQGRNIFIVKKNTEMYVNTDKIDYTYTHHNTTIYGKPELQTKSIARHFCKYLVTYRF